MIFFRAKGLPTSRLFDETTFYPACINDLKKCRSEVIIECPFMTGRRVAKLLPVFRELRRRNVRVTINTRMPQEHEERMRRDAEWAVTALQDMGIQVLFTGGHHRKLVILDRKVLYEGSLNVLSQYESCEVMRRIESGPVAEQMITFAKLNRFLD
jgi:hypothetical protein